MPKLTPTGNELVHPVPLANTPHQTDSKQVPDAPTALSGHLQTLTVRPFVTSAQSIQALTALLALSVSVILDFGVLTYWIPVTLTVSNARRILSKRRMDTRLPVPHDRPTPNPPQHLRTRVIVFVAQGFFMNRIIQARGRIPAPHMRQDPTLTGEYGCNTCAANYFTPIEIYPWDTASDCFACGLCSEHKYDAARDGLGCGLDQPTLCQSCPENAGTSHNDTFEARNVNITSRACNAGYYGPLGGPCHLCPAGYVKTERLDRDTTIDDCIQCPANTYEVSQAVPCYDCLAHSFSNPGSTCTSNCWRGTEDSRQRSQRS